MRALVTGITGQVGSHLADLLVAKGYEVHGLVRRQRTPDLSNLAQCLDKAHLHHADVLDAGAVLSLVAEVRPTEVYHLAAQSFVPESFTNPSYTTQVNVLGTLHVLEAVRNAAPRASVFFAGTSEMFGEPPESPQDEYTPMNPISPYGSSKLIGYHLVRIFRGHYGLRACSSIMFNTEGPRRGAEFVTQKVVRAAARHEPVTLGNLHARRDWGYSAEYVHAIWAMLQAAEPRDYVISTGQTHSVEDLCREAYACAGLDWQDYVRTSPEHHRPNELHELRGNPARIKEHLGWEAKTQFKTLVRIMFEAERARLEAARGTPATPQGARA